MADWRDANLYPNESELLDHWRAQGYFPNEQTLLSMWRWEFLRRRKDYRDAYAEQDARSQAYWDECFATEGVMNPAQKRADFDLIGARHLSRIADDFGLEQVRSPCWRFRIMPGGLFQKSYGWGYSTWMAKESDERGRKKIDARLRDDQMLIAFDLTLPLADQLNSAESHLAAIQAERYGQQLKSPRHHRRLWAKYLRVLDARDAGETFESIWQNIELDGLGVDEFDARAEAQNFAASGRQLWQQATDLMFKLTAKT